MSRTGPLVGFKVIEIAGIGPGPFAAMLLADMGAEVIRVERSQAVAPGPIEGPGSDLLGRGRRSVALDLKHPDGVASLLDLVEHADALLEGFRPGVMERLGVGPDVCSERNERLVYGRMTGWGQDGPYANAAGHDINYISLAGSLAHFRRAGEAPVPPLNLVGDFGGGGMFLAFGIVCALLEAQRSGRGQVVDTAMVDGTAVLMAMHWSFRGTSFYDETRPGTNVLDTGAPFYDVYECADGEYVSIGPIEPQFYAELLARTGLDSDELLAVQYDTEHWPEMKQHVAARFSEKTRAEWCELLEMTDVCFAPVLSMSEAATHPHNVARSTFVERDGRLQPAPAPRFSRTPAEIDAPPPHAGEHTTAVMEDWGIAPERVAELIASGAAVQAERKPTQ